MQYAIGVQLRLLLFIETTVFMREARRLMPDEEYRALQLALMPRPDAGDRIPGGGGLRRSSGSAPGSALRRASLP
jgi:hypothetical protein